jgi:hypothetical protein
MSQPEGDRQVKHRLVVPRQADAVTGNVAMTVMNLEQWTVERLATELERRFKESETLGAGVAEVGNVEWWGKAARLAGRRGRQRVRTMLSSDGSTVFAFLDRPVEPGEQAVAANRVTTLIFGPRPFVRHYRAEE